jgi:hypothetical protein
MAVNKVISASSLVIEIENGTDTKGNTIYRKKTFSGLKTDADAQDIFDVSKAIQGVLSVSTKDTYLDDTSKLVQA